MKRNTFAWVLTIVTVAIVVCSVILFSTTYHTEIDLTETKLQLYVFTSYSDGVIRCDDGSTLIMDNYAEDLFDEELFIKNIKAGDRIFARIAGKSVSADDQPTNIYSLVDGKQEYLSLDRLNERYRSAASNATMILVFGSILALITAVISVFLFISKNRR